MSSDTQGNKINTIQPLQLGDDKPSRIRKYRWLWFASVVVVLMIAIPYYMNSGSKSTAQYKTQKVKRGSLVITVTATGTLQPLKEVDVGSELSGTIRTVEVDFNDVVKKGQVLARLDTEQLDARVVQSRASLGAAEANLQVAMATENETKLKFERQERLIQKKLTSIEDMDAARAAYLRAKASVESARAQVAMSRASLASDETNLRKSVILSPINGIVLSRLVEPGQTVAASFQTPVLFTLAEDLRQMELNVDVDEADVGQVRKGQHASFSVDAYPDQRFNAQIVSVHYAPKVTQDVVTYEAVLTVDNSNLLLRPGMTATADIEVKKLKDALLIPNAALRFTPPVISTQSSTGKSSFLRALLPGPRSRPSKERTELSEKKKLYSVWVLQDGNIPVKVPVEIGSTNGRLTEVLKGEITPDMPVIVDMVRTTK
jgi:HlyD family secretion protein